MLTGGKPFVEDEQRSVMHKIRLERHVKVRKLNPDLPRELERIVDKCLEKQPRDRWRSAQHLVMALERFLAKYATRGPLRALLWPGFLVQKITTIELDDQQLEVALSALSVTIAREARPSHEPAGERSFSDFSSLMSGAAAKA